MFHKVVNRPAFSNVIKTNTPNKVETNQHASYISKSEVLENFEKTQTLVSNDLTPRVTVNLSNKFPF